MPPDPPVWSEEPRPTTPAPTPVGPAVAASGPSPAGAAAPGVAPPARTPWVRDEGAARHETLAAERWTVEGMSKVVRDADVGRLDYHGTVSIGGKLRAAAIQGEGPLEVLGPVTIDGTATIKGTCRFDQGLTAGGLAVDGAIGVRGAVTVRELARLEGEARFGGAVHAGRLVGRGALTVRGALTAERVNFDVSRDSTVESITADTVQITRPSQPPIRIPGLTPDPPTLTVLTIEAKEAILEGVSVEVLRADRVVLGADCHVARLIGNVVAADPRSHLGPESRSKPPYGIWR
jgi:hypothetical protein